MYPWGDARPYHSYAAYCRRTFGRPIQKLPVDGGFHLPQPRRHGRTRRLFVLLERGLHARLLRPAPHRPAAGRRRDRLPPARVSGRNGIPGLLPVVQQYLCTARTAPTALRGGARLPGVAGIVVGTRPDCVDAAKLDYLADLARRTYVCVEYGIESTSDATLRTIDRGHDFAAARRAIEATAARGVAVGAHFILGLPTRATRSCSTARASSTRCRSPRSSSTSCSSSRGRA